MTASKLSTAKQSYPEARVWLWCSTAKRGKTSLFLCTKEYYENLLLIMGFRKLLCQSERKGLLFWILNLAHCVGQTRVLLPFLGI
jgi:hypothetical protein